MIRKFFAIILVLIVVPQVFGQNPPDNDEILRATIDSSSPHYYPMLFSRFQSGDTTLTEQDYHYLYYGYAFTDDYTPLEPIPAENSLMTIIEKYPEPDAEIARQIIRYATQVMETDPFSPKNINLLIYAYGILGDRDNERINADRLEKIINTITSSGTGKKIDSPWHVLWVTHEYDVLAARGLQPFGRRIMSSTVEYVNLLEKDGNTKGYYFDYSRVYWKRPENLPDKRTSGLTINGINTRKRR